MVSALVHPQFVIDSGGHKRSVLLSVKEYQKLLQRMEDLEDALELDKAIRTAKGFRDYSEIRVELTRKGRSAGQ